jgi:hypothetical protein
MKNRGKRPPGVLFPEKGGYTKAQYAYYEWSKQKVANRDNYQCAYCGRFAPFKVKWGCKKQPNYQTDSPDAHPTTCPFLPTLPQDELIEKAYVEKGKETIRVFWKKGCLNCPDDARIKIVSQTERDLTDFCMHHIDGNPYNQSDSNVVFCCLSCNHQLENTKNGRKKEVDMLFSRKKQEEDSGNIEEQKIVEVKTEPKEKQMATLEVKTGSQINQDVLTRLQFLEEQVMKNAEQTAKNNKDINQKIYAIEDWVHFHNGGKTKQIALATDVKQKSNGSDMHNKTVDAIRKKTESKFKRIAYNEILQAIAGKGNPLKNEVHQMIGDILVKHQIGRTSYRGYVMYLIAQRKLKEDGQKRYKILI